MSPRLYFQPDTHMLFFGFTPMYANLYNIYICGITLSCKWPTATVFSRSAYARKEKRKIQNTTGLKIKQTRPTGNVSFRFTQELFTEQQTNIDEHSISIHTRSITDAHVRRFQPSFPRWTRLIRGIRRVRVGVHVAVVAIVAAVVVPGGRRTPCG